MVVRRVVLAVAVLMAVMPGLAWADNLTIQDPGLQIFQQTENSPCVIGDPSCKQPAGFGLGLIPSNTSPYDVTSSYTVSQLPTAFTIGIDVNTAQGQPIEILDLFTLDVLGSNVTGTGCPTNVEFCFASPLVGNDHQFILTNNGNGFSDSLLLGFNLSSFAATATVVFRAVVQNATDGREEFFIIPAGFAPIPEPGTLFLLGSGLVGVGAWGRRRFLRKAAS